MDFPDGHKAKSLENGKCAVCSNCAEINKEFGPELKANPKIADELKILEKRIAEQGKKVEPKLIARQKHLHDELKALKAKRDNYASRRDAIRSSKREAGVPNSQHPQKVERVPLTDRNGKPILDSSEKMVYTREYHYINTKGEKIVIQEHSIGHDYGGVGDQGPHFNVRPILDTRGGKVPGTKEHYNF